MITFIFSAGQQRRDSDVQKQLSALVKLKGEIDVAVSQLTCPNHASGSSASILLRALYYGSQWEIVDSCCGEFKRAIEFAVPIDRAKHEGHHTP